MANTRIVLNKQSDLKLTGAEILKPVGINEDDIAGLVAHFAKVENDADNEKKARAEGDAKLTSELAAEVASRKAADESHDTAILGNKTKIEEEIARAKTKDEEHDAAIAAEVASRKAADESHDLELAAIKNEHAADVVAINTAISNEQARAEAAEKVNADAITKEVTDRVSAVSAEENARIAGDVALQAALDAMDAAYKAADAGLQSAIDSAQAEINGILSGSTLDANSFAEIVAIMNGIDAENDTAFASYVSTNNATVLANKEAAEAADAKLTSDLANEVARATAAEAVNAAAIVTEKDRAEAAEAGITSSLNDEIANRTAADASFQTALDNEIADRVAGDSLLTSNLNAEIARAEAAEEVNAQAIADEKLARETKDALQDAALGSEVARAEAAEAGIQSDLDAYKSSNDAALAAEVARATDAEAGIQSDLDAYKSSNDAALSAEESSRIAGDAKLTSDLAAEVARANAAEAGIQSDLDAYKSSNDAALASEVARAEAAEAGIKSDLNAYISSDKAALATEVANREAGDLALQNQIDFLLSGTTEDLDQVIELVKWVEGIDKNNDASLLAAVEQINDSIDAESASRTAADQLLTDNLNLEISDREAADKSLQLNIDAVKSNLESEREARVKGDSELDGKIADIISNTDITAVDSFTEVVAKIDQDIKVASEKASMLIEASKPYMVGFNESPDGTGTTFTTNVVESQIVFLNGLMQLEDVDYTFKAGLVTFASTPAATDMINIYGIDGSALKTKIPVSAGGTYTATFKFDTEVASGSTVTAAAYDADGNLIKGEPTITPKGDGFGFTAELYSEVSVAKFVFYVDGVLYGETTMVGLLVLDQTRRTLG